MSTKHLAVAIAAIAAVVACVPQAGAQSNRPVLVRPPSNCTPVGNIQAIIDDSGSNRQNDPDGLRRNATLLFIGKPRNKAKTLGAVEFGTEALRLFEPLQIGEEGGPNRNRMETEINTKVVDDGSPGFAAPSGGGTDYNAAFDLATRENPNAQARIFLTDGEHNEGPYNLGHRQAPARTFVVGLSIGAPSAPYGDPAADTPEQRLQRIADETGGRYFPAVTSATLQETVNAIDAEVNCGAPPVSFTETLFRPGQFSPLRRIRTITSARLFDLVVHWTQAANRFDLIRLLALDSRNRPVAGDRRLFVNRRGRLRTTRRRGYRPLPRLRIERSEGTTYEALSVVKPRRAVQLQYRVQAATLGGGSDQVTSQASARR
jgi:hypothetical protein